MQNGFMWRAFTALYFLLLSLLPAVFPSSRAAAQGDLLVAPKRVVFEGRERYKELTLSNTGKDTARYAVSFIHYRMSEDGSLKQLPSDDSGLLFADKFVRFFPRSVTLLPGESQVVRLQLTKTGQMENGEFRSHLYLRSIPQQIPSGDTVIKTTDRNAITIKLNAVFGIAVPVILRVGESTTKVDVSHSSFQPSDKPFVKITLNRAGNMSCYGDIMVEYISPSGRVTKVGELNGIAVYTPLQKREVKLGLRTIPGIDYKAGKLHVVYQLTESSSQNSIGQTEIYLN
jgi:hypothetical protein